jgi:hypothetical protein
LTGDMVEATLEEPDTLSYERFVTDDGNSSTSASDTQIRAAISSCESVVTVVCPGVVVLLLRGVIGEPHRIAHCTFERSANIRGQLLPKPSER